ncbi:MAG TPA: hypothetical protein VKV33_11075 [Streptosporangiaceae bacterium]|nr:hypothetical protein [Streptosporangiaceae bacterium]
MAAASGPGRAAAGTGLISRRPAPRMAESVGPQFQIAEGGNHAAGRAAEFRAEQPVLRRDIGGLAGRHLVAVDQGLRQLCGAVGQDGAGQPQRTHILDKLALRDRVQAVIYAYENGIVEPGRT